MNKLNDNKGGRESITLGPVTLLGLFHCAAHYRSIVFDNRARKLLHLMRVSVPITPWTPNPLPIFSTPASENKFVTPSTAAAHAWHEWLIAALLITFIMKIVLRPRKRFSKIIASRLKMSGNLKEDFVLRPSDTCRVNLISDFFFFSSTFIYFISPFTDIFSIVATAGLLYCIGRFWSSSE